MARLNTKLTLEAPDEISVPLVRADVLATSNKFRSFAEIFLSLTSALTGVVLSIDAPTLLHYISLVVCGLFTICFFFQSSPSPSK